MEKVLEKRSPTKEQEDRKRLLKALTYEYRNGKPIYYRDYKKVLSGELALGDVIGSSSIHALLVMLIGSYLMRVLGEKFIVLGGELGYIPKKGTRYNLDVAVFEREKLLKEGIKDNYVKTPPYLVVEIDTKIDHERFGSVENYIVAKTNDLLKSGVKLVIWVLTKEKKVLYAESGKDWLISDWNKELKVAEGVTLNVGKLVESYL